MESLSADRATLGSTINTLNSAVDNLAATIENYGNSLSQIRDTDMAAESAGFSKSGSCNRLVLPCSQANAQPNGAEAARLSELWLGSIPAGCSPHERMIRVRKK